MSKTEVYIDEAFLDEFIELMTLPARVKKVRRILYEILSGRYNEDLYGREEVSEKAKNITAMKFKGKENLRIYCKEIMRDGKFVILITSYKKKTQKIDKKLKTLLETVGGYEYSFEE